MSQHNRYARSLDEAFRKAREEYTEAWNKLQSAKKASADAQAARAESYRGENEGRRARAKAALLEAEHAFQEAEKRVWAEFDQQKVEIRRDLEKDVRASSIVDPDAIDANAVELLKSGIMTADDIFSMATRYDNNSTMLRIVGKHAKELAEDRDADPKTRGELYTLSNMIGSGANSTMRNFDDLVEIANYCSGRGGYGTKRIVPGHTISMSQKWEELSSAAVENF